MPTSNRSSTRSTERVVHTRSSRRERAGFGARATIDRNDFGLRWNQTLEAGGVLVGDRVEIDLDIQAVTTAASQVACICGDVTPARVRGTRHARATARDPTGGHHERRHDPDHWRDR
jgi:hypothetical protein